MNVQNAARPVCRWNVVGDEVEVEVESVGARFSCAGVEAAVVVEAEIRLILDD
jgi:hypothetical protein